MGGLPGLSIDKVEEEAEEGRGEVEEGEVEGEVGGGGGRFGQVQGGEEEEEEGAQEVEDLGFGWVGGWVGGKTKRTVARSNLRCLLYLPINPPTHP